MKWIKVKDKLPKEMGVYLVQYYKPFTGYRYSVEFFNPANSNTYYPWNGETTFARNKWRAIRWADFPRPGEEEDG